ncbi:OFA family oxalate/formate antiporter-like MFS transporter [Evansella vedderi]|uniref:OFA family oxalate/formate antiporter-like MFS transporter n=1 Tax=Evansella vedderi TaxID=38282 RepID=A0ABT9ZYI3_9BACI|nr:OFA family MFS transporter [Evansella vedderi]MDQ0255792.1 OFA family oxalate/formate antiporter-like MFS transporter [Evansella vedderi]
MNKTKNRWLIALSAVGIHISIGSVYAWSVYTTPIIEQFGWSLTDVQLTFSIAILFLGLSAAFLGHFVEKYGPRKAGILSACFFGIGIFGSGLAVLLENIYLLYLFYGVFGGIGLGVGYITPVSTLVKWFPDRRGLATGLAIMGFGFASMVSSPIINMLISSVGLMNTFYILGLSYFVIIISSAQYLAPPEKGWVPKGFKAKGNNTQKVKQDLAQLTANEAIKTKRFWYLWGMLFINITCGIAIISVASPLAQETVGLNTAAAATMVGLIGVFNGIGRIAWASFSDYIGRTNTYMAFFIIQIVAYFTLPSISHVLLFQVILFLVMTCYGGGFASIPAYIGDLFGTKQLSAIHGYMLTAWAAAGLVGPILTAWVRETTGSYQSMLYVFGSLFVLALGITLLVRSDIKKIQQEQKTAEQKVLAS